MKPPSSTSNSDRGPARAIVLTAVAVVVGLIAAELAFRLLLPSLSANSRTLAASDARAERLRLAETTTILILGNSISGDGIDAELLRTELATEGIDVEIAHQPADTTVMRDWFYELDNLFVRRGAVPDILLLPVGDTAPLSRLNARTEDLMFSFLTLGDLPAFFARSDIHGFEERAAAVFAKASALYSFRGRFQKRVLVALAPGYETLRLAMLEAGTMTDGEHEISTDKRWYRLMANLTDDAGIRVVVTVVPTVPLEAGMPPADVKIAELLGWDLLEPGRADSWTLDDRPDGLHLQPEARARYTRLLAGDLARLLRSSPGER